MQRPRHMHDYPGGHQLTLLEGTRDFFAALMADIDRAQQEVRLETYIFHVYGSGEQVALALERAARRGVAVMVVVDGVGTPVLPNPWPARLAAAGVQWQVFSPLGRWGLLVPSRWRRLHRKLCAIDGLVTYCGGINVLDDWHDPNHGALSAPRFDFAVRATGPLVQSVHAAMAQFWWRLRAVRSAQQVDWGSAWQALQNAVAASRPSGAAPIQPASGGARATLVLRDNVYHRRRIERAYLQALADARVEVVLANAYFLPGRKMRRALIHAAQRGVRVRLLLQGRYEYFMQYHATRALYQPLLAAGVEIYEYTRSFLHAKVAVVDGRWATVGSSNIDPLSLLLAREANVMVHDARFAAQLSERLELAIRDHAVAVHLTAHLQRSIRQRVLDKVALLLMRTVLLLNGKRY